MAKLCDIVKFDNYIAILDYGPTFKTSQPHEIRFKNRIKFRELRCPQLRFT